MDSGQILNDVKAKLAAATEHLRAELSKIRTGRAHPGMLDNVMVEVYGQVMPLKAVAGIVTPEATQLQITPFDPNNLEAIVTAVRGDQSLGLNPADDGRVVRIQIPPLTTETRAAMAKVVGQKLEEALISGRNARHEAFKKLDQTAASKDEAERAKKQIDEALAGQRAQAEDLAKTKESELLTV